MHPNCNLIEIAFKKEIASKWLSALRSILNVNLFWLAKLFLKNNLLCIIKTHMSKKIHVKLIFLIKMVFLFFPVLHRQSLLNLKFGPC